MKHSEELVVYELLSSFQKRWGLVKWEIDYYYYYLPSLLSFYDHKSLISHLLRNHSVQPFPLFFDFKKFANEVRFVRESIPQLFLFIFF